MIHLYNDDCFNVFPYIEPKSIDLVFCDLPYGVLQKTKWDIEFDLERMWENIKQFLKPNSACVFTCTQPFTSRLVSSNYRWFKHHWIWNKKSPSNGILAKKQPLKVHEEVVVFMNGKTKYFPIMVPCEPRKKDGGTRFGSFGVTPLHQEVYTEYYPKTIVTFSKANRNSFSHLTEKPVPLVEYFIQTYSQENEVVIDFTMGCGSTGVACVNLNRNFIGIEIEKEFFDIAQQRINKTNVN